MAYKPKYLRHINVYVRIAESSQKLYEDVLGLHACDFRLGRAALISADIEQFHGIALMQVADDASSPLENHVGLNRTAWMMESLDDLKELG